MKHTDDDTLPASHATGEYQNFIVEARFYNPYSRSEGSWDYGFGFRSTGGNQQYRLSVDSDGDWDLSLISGKRSDGRLETMRIKYGNFGDLNGASGGSNALRLVVKDTVAYFFINNQYVATLDVSDKNVTGSVWVGTVFFSSNTLSGKTTRYEGFTVWSLP